MQGEGAQPTRNAAQPRETNETDDVTAHLGTVPTSPCKGEVDRAAGGRGSGLLLKRSVKRDDRY